MEEKKIYAVFGGDGEERRGSEYRREFGGGNEIKLVKGIARPVSEEVADILRHTKGVILFSGIDETPVNFRKKLIREDWQDLVKKHGIEKAKIVREEQDERIRQAGEQEAPEGDRPAEVKTGG